jgi:hypothetical protein
MQKFSICANTHPCSNYFSPIVGGASMLALAYWMDPGPPPSVPAGTKVLKPLALKEGPAKGVPLAPLRSREALLQWLWSGPIYVPASLGELIEKLGDIAAAPVREGRAFKLADREYTFQPATREVLSPDGLYPWRLISREEPECTGVGILAFTVVENSRAGYYTVHLPAQGATHCSINGLELADRAYVRLEAGLYPLLVAFTGDKDTMVPVGPVFDFITDSQNEMDVLIAEGKERFKSEQLLYDLTLADHKATGMDAESLHTARMTFAHMYRSHRLLMGSGGYQSEGEAYHHTAMTPVSYAAALWNVFGQTLSAYPDYTHGVVRHFSHGVFRESKNRPPSLAWQSFNGGNHNGNPYHFLRAGFAFTPEEYKPAMLWFWNRMAGVKPEDPESYVNLVNDHSLGDVIYTFINYPLDPKTGKASLQERHPNEAFPKTWQALDKGLYVFRNQWQDARDIVLQVYANELMSKGHGQPDAAGIRLHGLGFDWTNDSPGKGEPYRWLQNVVFLPKDDTERRAPGRVTSWHAEKDGSGHVTINMDSVYRPTGGVRHDAVGIWPPDLPAPGEVTGLRAVAADYSGKCGAPALFVLVDKVVGGGERKWLWHLPSSGGKHSHDAFVKDMRVEAVKNGFAIHQGGASLRAVFVAPAAPAVEAPGTIMARHSADKKYASQKARNRDFRPDPEPTPVDIVATAKPGESFFVILTMQEGPAPEVKIEKGEGLDTVARIGRQRVRFDGERAWIEDE